MTPEKRVHIIPDLLKTIGGYDGCGRQSEAKQWLNSVKVAARLSCLSENFVYESACLHLTGAVHQWLQRKRTDIRILREFRSIFVQTFIPGGNQTELWNDIQSCRQRSGEHVADYFHRKVNLCSFLKRSFKEIKKHVADGLFSRDTKMKVLSTYHDGEDPLFREILDFE